MDLIRVDDVIGRIDSVLDGALRPDGIPPPVAARAPDAGN
jgi:hypothetical protein